MKHIGIKNNNNEISFYTLQTPCSRVDIQISCRNLLDKDVMSKSDPCAVMYMLTKTKWFEVHFFKYCYYSILPDGFCHHNFAFAS